MKGESILLLLSLMGVVLSAPSGEQGLVLTSTEPTKESAKKDTSLGVTLDPVIYEMNIHSNISNRFAKTLVVSKVRNPNQVSTQTTFSVVLPEKAFISEFVMEIGGKSYKAYVKEKEEAKNIYDQAVSSGISAAHVAVSARDSNRFTVSVNIEPEAKAVFLLTYEELLERKNNQYELVLNIHPGKIVKSLNIEVQINETRPLKFVQTPSLRSGNEIRKSDDKLKPTSDIEIVNFTSAVVKFQPNAEQQKQFALNLGTKESDGLSGQFVVQYDVERDPHGGEILLQDGYFVHFFAPEDLEPLLKHVVFVLDSSGSMWGRRMEQLKSAMDSILSELREGDNFNIIDFSFKANVWDTNSGYTQQVQLNNFQDPYPELRENNLFAPLSANADAIRKAKSAIMSLNANGATNIISGLETALYLIKRDSEHNVNSNVTRQPIIVFLTDGEPNVGISSKDQITQLVTSLNAKNDKMVPIFSLSFGEGADKAFLRKLSLKNLGFSRHIYEAADASLQLQDFYKQISSPLLSNIEFKYDAEVKDVTNAVFPIFFKGTELVVTGRYKDSLNSPFIRARGCTGVIKVKPTVETRVTSLERLWAYLTVKQALDQRETVENKTELTKKALNLALKYSFVTDVSSLVVVKPNDTSAVNTENAGTAPGSPYAGGVYHKMPVTSSAGGAYSTMDGGQKGSKRYYHAPPAQGSRPSNSYVSPALSIPQAAYRPSPPPRAPTTTFATPLTTIPNKIEDALPWLSSILNPNRTLSIKQGVYELGDTVLHERDGDACPKTPLNDTDTGHCALLKDCPEVYPYLTDFAVYQQYFCPVENIYAGVCCPHQKTTN